VHLLKLERNVVLVSVVIVATVVTMVTAIPIDNIVTDLFNALPGQTFVNTFQRATIEAVSQ
jgi:hypothetical protein